ncbi:hypothetical protein MseVgp159 [Melanoplus sanguinipes entomopoxvirus]|uniref:Uncharacterized protein n=1 Tax=Melanoplus sanguinipes entomopoxvirus TaxID=83191 RepID=Q9YVT3_MSEPV|nr:hypothetical protein MseVgp159 [Melanoplus sanguinipes entomopoxvirus]AAC97780.1 ORF MSV159 hypothetical protein [Melanoplus sanguinipes entomopoxvirus 'O']
MYDNLLVFDSCSIINSLFKEICFENYIIFIDWTNTIWDKYEDKYVFRNGNIKTADDYNRVLNDNKCYGFYVITDNIQESSDAIFELQNLGIKSDLFQKRNKLDNKNTDIYELSYYGIIKSKDDKLNTSRIIENFLKDNYNFVLNKLYIYYITGNMCNVVQNLIFSKIKKTILYIPSREDEIYLQDNIDKNNCYGGNNLCTIKRNLINISNIIKQKLIPKNNTNVC